jgi:hypothetical protein
MYTSMNACFLDSGQLNPGMYTPPNYKKFPYLLTCTCCGASKTVCPTDVEAGEIQVALLGRARGSAREPPLRGLLLVVALLEGRDVELPDLMDGSQVGCEAGRCGRKSVFNQSVQ